MRTLPGTPAVTATPTAPAPAVRPVVSWPGQAIMDSPETAQVLHAAWSGDPAVIVPSPPAAGKTRLVALLAAAVSHLVEMLVWVSAQTREHA